jgi:uncharacterized protein YjdB
MKKILAFLTVLMLLTGGLALAENVAVTVTYAKSNITLSVGTSTSVMVKVAPYVAKKKGITYASSDEAIATVTAKGRLTAVAEGECQLVVASVYDPTVSVSIPVHVIVPVDNLTLTAENTSVAVGKTLQLNVTYEPANASLPNATFTSSNESVATISESGLVTGEKRGTVTITAVSADENEKATLKVNVIQLSQSVSITPESGKAVVGRTVKLKTTVLPKNANDQTVTWSSNDESIATVNAKGVVTIMSIGTANITATSNADAAISATIPVQGVQLAQSVALDSELYAVVLGQTTQLHQTVLPDTTTDQSVTYKVGNSRIASVDANGLVTALKGGKTTVTVTTADGSKKSDSATVQVLVPVTGVSYKYRDVRVGVGNRNSYTASIAPSSATNKNMTWVSSDKSIATVSGTTNRFYVKGLRWGRCKVTGTTEDGSFSVDVNVNVGSLNKAITVLDATIKDGKPYLSLRNASNMNITEIRYRMVGYDSLYNKVKMSTSDDLYVLQGVYDTALAEGEVTGHGQFTFYNHSDYSNLAILKFCVTGWSTDTGYYNSNGEKLTNYNLSDNNWNWIIYPADTNPNLLK